MARRRKENLFDILTTLPWWVGVLIAILIYVLITFILPLIFQEDPILGNVAKNLSSSPLAIILSLLALFSAAISAFNSWQKRRLLDNQRDIDSIRALPWKAFEELVAEAYRRKGFRVIENIGGGADGGVDIRLEKHGQVCLIQCKNWRNQKIAVNVVREMLGIMSAEKASSVIVICSGDFTQEAKNFAANLPIELINGRRLEKLVADVKRQKKNLTPNNAKPCPLCGSDLVLKTAKRGKNIGNKFYGCSSYPKCRHITPY